MKKALWLGLVVLVGLPLQYAGATGWRKDSNDLNILNRRLQGRVVDYTANHGKDNRIWSRSLYERRDLYVYLPPGFDPHESYPLILLLHGFAQDERVLFEFAPILDSAIVAGKMPPVIVACPDGSLQGEPYLLSPGSFFLNTHAGDFEDFVTCDVWDFMTRHYPIRPEREAHVLAGVSMGGFAAYNLGIRHRNAFGVVVGVFPPLNLRWVDDHGFYRAKFDPHHWGWRTEVSNPRETIARFYGLITLRINHLIGPLFGEGEEAIFEIARQNPIELIDRTGLRNGELEMYVAYAGRDEFNIDAQVESFLYLCNYRGIAVAVGYDPKGGHNMATAVRMMPDIFHWLTPRLMPYSPPLAFELNADRRRDRRLFDGLGSEGRPAYLPEPEPLPFAPAPAPTPPQDTAQRTP